MSHRPDRRQRGHHGDHSGKQKKAQLQASRQRQREKEAHAREEDAFEAALLESAARIPKVVQARCYTYRVCRGAEVSVRLKLSIDRQLCAGFNEPAVDVADAPAPAETPEQRRARQFKQRATGVSTRLSATAKLKSLRDVEREWLDGLNQTLQLVQSAADEPVAARPFLFGVVQQALQTGPLNYGKPAQFKRFHKAIEKENGRTIGEHPQVKSVRRLLDAIEPLLTPAPPPAAALEAAAADEPEEVADPGANEVEAGAPAAAGAAAAAAEGEVAATPYAFSEKQSALIRQWLGAFRAFFDAGSENGPPARSAREQQLAALERRGL